MQEMRPVGVAEVGQGEGVREVAEGVAHVVDEDLQLAAAAAAGGGEDGEVGEAEAAAGLDQDALLLAQAGSLALARQARPPDLVVVADNFSTDDTVEVLENLADLPFKLVVRRLPENRGNAGGVEEAMDQAFAEGADAVWILDDDSWPREAARGHHVHTRLTLWRAEALSR